MRHGQWVKFIPPETLAIPGEAFRLADGSVVGIYQCHDQRQTGTHRDAAGNETPVYTGGPERVVLQKATGDNIRIDGQVAYVAYAEIAAAVVAVTDRNDLPPGRLATAPPDWQPKP